MLFFIKKRKVDGRWVLEQNCANSRAIAQQNKFKKRM